MIGARTRRGSEAIAHNLNRRHQIVLNLELSRLDMQKRMLERYFLYEISLIRARQARLMYRQREVKVNQPKQVPSTGELPEKNSSVFITSVSLENVQRAGFTLPAISNSSENLSRQGGQRKTVGEYGEKKKAGSAGSPYNQGRKETTRFRKVGHASRKNNSGELDRTGDLPPVKMVCWSSKEDSPVKEKRRGKAHAEMREQPRKDGKKRTRKKSWKKKIVRNQARVSQQWTHGAEVVSSRRTGTVKTRAERERTDINVLYKIYVHPEISYGQMKRFAKGLISCTKLKIHYDV